MDDIRNRDLIYLVLMLFVIDINRFKIIINGRFTKFKITLNSFQSRCGLLTSVRNFLKDVNKTKRADTFN